MPTKKYPMVPIVAAILKVVAVILFILLVVFGAFALQETAASWAGGASGNPFSPPSAPVTAFGPRLKSLIGPLFQIFQYMIYPFAAWLLAELALALRDTEYNTRVGAGIAEEPVAESPTTPPAPREGGTSDEHKTE